jgi:hypothetical protein
MDRFSNNNQISNFMKIRPVEAEFHADGRTVPAKLIMTFWNFANEPKNEIENSNCTRKKFAAVLAHWFNIRGHRTFWQQQYCTYWQLYCVGAAKGERQKLHFIHISFVKRKINSNLVSSRTLYLLISLNSVRVKWRACRLLRWERQEDHLQ